MSATVHTSFPAKQSGSVSLGITGPYFLFMESQFMQVTNLTLCSKMHNIFAGSGNIFSHCFGSLVIVEFPL